MEGGQAWKEQLRLALRSVDTEIVLLTPQSAKSPHVRWEWEQALNLGKRVIPILIAPCDVPDELAKYHYHNFSDPAKYSLGFASLIRDLNRLNSSNSGSNSQPFGKHTNINLLIQVWDVLEPDLQDVLTLAYNQARRDGVNMIKTRYFLAAS